MNWVWSTAFYVSVLSIAFRTLGLVRPVRRLGVPTRRRALVLIIVGVASLARSRS